MDGNLLHFAVEKNLKEHVQILLKHGLVFFHGKTLNEMVRRFDIKLIFRCDPKAPMVAHGHKSPLDMAIINGQMDFWDIMREGMEFTKEEKLLQLRRMILEWNGSWNGKMEEDNPCNEFKELLSSLPVEMVIFIQAIITEFGCNHFFGKSCPLEKNCLR